MAQTHHIPTFWPQEGQHNSSMSRSQQHGIVNIPPVYVSTRTKLTYSQQMQSFGIEGFNLAHLDELGCSKRITKLDWWLPDNHLSTFSHLIVHHKGGYQCLYSSLDWHGYVHTGWVHEVGLKLSGYSTIHTFLSLMYIQNGKFYTLVSIIAYQIAYHWAYVERYHFDLMQRMSHIWHKLYP